VKIGLVQLNPKIGSPHIPIHSKIKEAKEKGAQLVLLPELSTTGYPPRDLIYSSGLIENNLNKLKEAQDQSQGICVVCGYIKPNTSGKGRPFYNAAAVFIDGKHKLTYHKRLLPTYDVFEEDRYFEPGKESSSFEYEGLRFGISICEDLWVDEEFGHYAVVPIDDIKASQPDVLLNLSASPFRVGKPGIRTGLIQKVSAQIGCPVVYCNQVGGNDELIFDGASFVMGADGKFLAQLPAFESCVEVVDLESPKFQPAWPKNGNDWVLGALSLGLRDYVQKCGGEKVLLGLSGGIDSALTAVIAVEALGKENVLMVSMPTRYTSAISLEDAQTLATNLGTQLVELSIETLFQQYEKVLGSHLPEVLGGVALENLQPRLRMTVLMAIANQQDRMLLNTSNKSEIATGYSTLYGDSTGALSVIGDLTKTQVYQLAKYLNEKKTIIPSRIIERPPSAELRENQTDQDTLPPYKVLDPVLVEIVENHRTEKECLQMGLAPDVVAQFMALYRKSEYKRRQLPPVLRVSKRAFGMGRRVPIAADI